MQKLLKTLRNGLLHFAHLLAKTMSLLPLPKAWVYKLSLGFYWPFSITKIGRTGLINANLKHVFPHSSERQRRILATGHWRSLYYALFRESSLIAQSRYYTIAQRIKNSLAESDNFVKFSGLEHLKDTKDCGVIYSLAHMHSMELAVLCAFFISQQQHKKFYYVTKDPTEPISAKVVTQNRGQFSGEKIDQANAKKMLEVLREGHNLSMPADQYVRPIRPVEVKFLHDTIKVQPAVARLAKLGKACIVPIEIFRQKNLDYRIIINPPLCELENKSLTEITQFMYDGFERNIRRRPSQYIWNHNIFFRHPR